MRKWVHGWYESFRVPHHLWLRRLRLIFFSRIHPFLALILSWVRWIAPYIDIVNDLFGVFTGSGVGLIAYDWIQGAGSVLFYWIPTPILYYTNVWQAGSAIFPSVSFKEPIDPARPTSDIYNILTENLRLNKTAYAEHSPVYLSASFCVTYMVAFVLSTALIVHTTLYHDPRIYRAIVNVKTEADDIHYKLMKMYPEVSD
ncbi:hypothetical protein IAR50_000671 [Cryptococcus sp. DSM 104548]